MPKTDDPNKPAQSRRQLARLCGVTHQTIAKWIEHPDWPFGNEPNYRWRAEDVLQWRKQTLESKGSGEVEHPKIERLKTARIIEQTKHIRAQRLQLEAECERRDAVVARTRRKRDLLLEVTGTLPERMRNNPRFAELPEDKRAIAEEMIAAEVESIKAMVRHEYDPAEYESPG